MKARAILVFSLVFITSSVFFNVPAVADDSVTVSTISAPYIYPDKAECRGSITISGNVTIKERGFEYHRSLDHDNPVDFKRKPFGAGSGTFNGTITSLRPGHYHSYRAYAIDKNDVEYFGLWKSFVTTQGETVRLMSPESFSETFGYSLSMLGEHLLVGDMPRAGSWEERSGIVYLYRYDAEADKWNVHQSFSPPGELDKEFGKAVSLTNDWIVISGAERTFIYKRNRETDSWGIHTKFDFDVVRTQVRITGNVVVFGLPEDDTFGENSGKAVIYRFDAGSNSWKLEKALYGNDPQEDYYFGAGVWIHKDLVIVNSLENRGTARIYQYNGSQKQWHLMSTIACSAIGGSYDEWGGHPVLINEKFVVIGADRENYWEQNNNHRKSCGATYIYLREDASNWELIQKIEPDPEDWTFEFGSTIAIDKNMILAAGTNQSSTKVPLVKLNDNTGDISRLWRLNEGMVGSASISYNKVASNFRWEGIVTIYSLDTFNSAPIARNPRITGQPYIGSTLTAKYRYLDYEDDPEGETEIQWYRCDDAEGTNRRAIPYANNRKYEIQSDDLNKFIQFSIRPVATSGSSIGLTTNSSFSEEIINPLPVVDTGKVMSTSSSSSVCEGVVTLADGSRITDKGFVYSLTDVPTLASRKISAGALRGRFQSALTGLKPNSLYYFRAYGKNAYGVSYGNVKTFRTLPVGQHKARIYYPSNNIDNSFGHSISLSDSHLAVGSYKESRVYVFKNTSDNNDWILESTLNNNGLSCGHFGAKVLLGGDFLFVAAQSSPNVFIYKNDEGGGWKLTDTISSPGAADKFGRSMAFQNNTLVVSDSEGKADGYKYQSGLVHVFQYLQNQDKWVLQTTIKPPKSQAGAYFGSRVNIDADQIVIDAHYMDSGGFEDAGEAYLFKFDETRNKYVLSSQLTDIFPGKAGRYSKSTGVVVIGNHAITSRSASKSNGTISFFTKNADKNVWNSSQLASGWEKRDNYGSRLTNSGDIIAFSSSLGDYRDPGVIVFTYKLNSTTNSWHKSGEIQYPDITSGFGDLSLSDNVLAVSLIKQLGHVGYVDVYNTASSKNSKPIAYDLTISGPNVLLPGRKVRGEYKYYDKEGDVEAGTTFSWYTIETSSPNLHLLKGYNKQEIVIPKYVGGGSTKALIFAVRPKAVKGNTEGIKEFSLPRATRGSLKVVLRPTNEYTVNSGWSIDDGDTWHSSNTTLQHLKSGRYKIIYKALSGWMKPEKEFVEITKGKTSFVTATYTRK